MEGGSPVARDIPMEKIATVDGVDVYGTLPDKPDPLWPQGAEPKHLGPTVRKDAAVAAAYGVGLNAWKCSKCGAFLPKSTDDRYCVDCFKTEKQNSAVAQKVNADWMEQSTQLGLALYERQPEETDVEWRIWEAYRRHYPLKMPNWSELAKETGCAPATVVKAAGKWSFRVRLQAWARYTDDTMLEERAAAIKEMNSKQLGMAKTIQDKLKEAIEGLEPALLKPNEIVNLFKIATELERRVVTAMPEKVEGTMLETGSKTEQLTKAEDLSEVVSILTKAGVINLEGKTVGVEQSTRIIVKEND